VGNETDSVDGTDAFRFQELLGAGQFASVGSSLLIDQLSFRAAPGTGPVDFTVTSLSLLLSTSPKFPNTSGPLMTSTFADNVGPDNTLVFSGPVSVASLGCAGPSVCSFDIHINFTTAFLYNPAQGRLLLDFKFTGFSPVDGKLDSVSFSPPNGGSVASLVGGLNDTIGGTVGFDGDIVQLRYTAVPEPTSGALILIGVSAYATMRRRRSASVRR
jgi:hypothetical protein